MSKDSLKRKIDLIILAGSTFIPTGICPQHREARYLLDKTGGAFFGERNPLPQGDLTSPKHPRYFSPSETKEKLPFKENYPFPLNLITLEKPEGLNPIFPRRAEKYELPIPQEDLTRTLLEGNSRIKDPVRKALAIKEYLNPSIGAHERIEYRCISLRKIGLVPYQVRVVQDRVGTDFTTNQPVYKKREVFLG